MSGTPVVELTRNHLRCNRESLSARWEKIVDGWLKLQLTHYGGKYSVERVLALEQYAQQTSLLRVLVVTVGVPLFVVAFVLLQESIPLQSPTEGWKANYGFWARVMIIGATIGYVAATQVASWLDIHRLSFKQRMFYSFGVGVGYATIGMAAAEIWVFPVPFIMLSLSTPTSAVLIGLFWIVVGAREFGVIISRREQRRRMNNIAALQGFMTIVYPTYQVLFAKTNHTCYELPVLLFLPVFKLFMRIIFAKSAAHKEDTVPAQVVFTVEFFDALYLATLMQRISSTSLASVLVVDFVHNAVELREMNQRTQHILACLQRHIPELHLTKEDGILHAIRVLCSSSEMLPTDVRTRSCHLHSLNNEGETLLATLGSFQRAQTQLQMTSSNAIAPSPNETVSNVKTTQKSICVHPSQLVTVLPEPVLQTQNSTTSLGQDVRMRESSMRVKSNILREAVEVLFTSEVLVLTEYVEIAIPVLYGAYVRGMVHIPSKQYHEEMAGISLDNVDTAVQRMLVYALLELISLGVLAAIIQRNCRLQVFYQLAFVLETEMEFVLSTLILWMLMTLTYRVEHFGTDLSFQFKWIGRED